MSDNEQKAQALVQEAEKKLNSSKGFLGNLFGYVSQLTVNLVKITQVNYFFTELCFNALPRLPSQIT